MSIRSKLLVIFLLLGIAPMLLVSIVNYVSSVRTIERMLLKDMGKDAARIARQSEERIHACESDLVGISRLPSLHAYMRGSGASPVAVDGTGTPDGSPRAVSPDANSSTATQAQPVQDELRKAFEEFIIRNHDAVAAVTCLDERGQPLLRGEGGETQADGKIEVRFQTSDFVSSSVRADERVWTTKDAAPLRLLVMSPSSGALLCSTAPVFLDGAGERVGGRGALVVEIKIGAILKQAETGQPVSVAAAKPDTASGTNAGRNAVVPSRFVVALDASQNIVYHTSDALKHQPVAAQMPFFKPVADQMTTGVSGTGAYEDKAADGDRWLAAFHPVGDTKLSVAVAENYSQAVGALQRAGLSGLALALLAALGATGALVVLARRTSRRIERVAAGAEAVAGGNLNQRIEVESNDETRVLAESFNRMTDRVREQIQREAETRQFQSFMRLSAMLTHDLKNSIQGLSLLVNNMERQFHRAEFRADAISDLREATDKLRRLVARLSEPVKSLSGEYRRDARLADLVPVINRVLDTTARASAPLYQLDVRLPPTLEAFCEPERIENVIENLIINAMEAMGTGGGNLTVEAGEETSERVFLNVSDTGVGMTQEFVKNRLFKPFSTTKSKGIGLGLFTCREIVETHGGRLEVESQVGIGTRFRVVLPSKPLTLRERLEQSQGSSTSTGGAGSV